MAATQTLFKIDSDLTKITIHFLDEEIVKKFYNFLFSNKITPAVMGNAVGNFRFQGFFTKTDAEKIIQFLTEENCRKCQILPS